MVQKFLTCGDLTKGFARVRCDTCRHEYLLALSCNGRYSCPSCHQKRVIEFGAWVAEEVLVPVPHRQFDTSCGCVGYLRSTLVLR